MDEVRACRINNLSHAEDRGATLVVVGRRGQSHLKEVVLASVSNAAVHDGRGPVLVVPSVEQ